MSLYDVPVHDGFKVLTHTSTRRFDKNGYGQVGNELFPKHPINPQSVKTSSIYNKNISGISEAGYGRRYPNYGLSKYPGAGSPRASLSYPGAGSPKSSLMAYMGAGSPRTSLKNYYGAGSPRGSVLSDAYINDNPPPGKLFSLSGLSRVGIPGRPSTRRQLSGLSDTPAWVDTGLDYNMVAPDESAGGPVVSNVTPVEPSGGLLSEIGNVFGTLFNTATKAVTNAGSAAVSRSITGAVNPPPAPTIHFLPTTTTGKILGMSTGTLLLAAAGAAYFLTRKK